MATISTHPVTDRTPGKPAATLYVGHVMHARLKPVVHRFRYRVMSLLLDLDRLAEADRISPLFGINRRALYSFHERDHGDGDGSSLRRYAERRAAECGLSLAGGRVELLCYPRLLGFGFNPLSVYFCRDASARLVLVLYEVRNTFGEVHTYCVPVHGGDESAVGLRQQHAKTFYVSPFVPLAAQYLFRINPPIDTVKLRILETDADGPLLAATFHGRRRALTTAALLWSLAALPLVTFKIAAAIHWEALRLWLKGVPWVPRPSAPRRPRSSRALAAKAPRWNTWVVSIRRIDGNATAPGDHPAERRQHACGPATADTPGLPLCQ